MEQGLSQGMTGPISLATPTLYERDYLLWLTTTAAQLRQGKLADVDLENLIEEIESMGRSERHSLKSLLTLLLVHLLKLAYWESARERNIGHWREEILNFREQIRDYLADSPSLKPYSQEIFLECYARARRRAAEAMEIPVGSLPASPIATLEQALDECWFPIAVEDEEP